MIKLLNLNTFLMDFICNMKQLGLNRQLYSVKGHKLYFPNNNYIVYILANIVDADEMLHNAAFHLGLHYLHYISFLGSE